MWSRKLQEYSGLYKEIQRSFRGCFKEFNDVSRQGQLCTKSFSWFQRCFKDGLMKLQSCFHSASLILAEVFQEGFKYVSGRLGLSWGGFQKYFQTKFKFLRQKFQTLSEAPGMFRECFKETVCGSCNLF